MASFTAFWKRCLQPRYRSVVSIETRPSRNWICSNQRTEPLAGEVGMDEEGADFGSVGCWVEQFGFTVGAIVCAEEGFAFGPSAVACQALPVEGFGDKISTICDELRVDAQDGVQRAFDLCRRVVVCLQATHRSFNQHVEGADLGFRGEAESEVRQGWAGHPDLWRTRRRSRTRGQLMKILLLGANGAVGQLALNNLLEANHEETALVRKASVMQTKHPRFTVVQGEATDAAELDRVLAGQDAVLSTLGALASKRTTLRANVAGNLVAGISDDAFIEIPRAPNRRRRTH